MGPSLALRLLSATLCIALARAQSGGCTDGTANVALGADRITIPEGMRTEYHCNVDPSEESYGVVFGVEGSCCAADGNGVVVQPNAYYTGVDGVVSTATGIPTTIPQTTLATVFAEFTSLPYSSLDPEQTILVYNTYYFDATSAVDVGYLWTQQFSRTLFYTQATSVSTSNVPSPTTTTITITGQAVTEGTTSTTTVTTTNGVATSNADPSTTTTTTTVTPRPKTITKSVYVVKTKTVTSSCLPPGSSVRAAFARAAVTANRFNIRQAGPPSFIPMYCNDTAYSTTTYTTGTDYSTTIVTVGVTTLTSYDSTTTTSTYYPTNTVYQGKVSRTTTITPTLTVTAVSVIKQKKKTRTFTTIRTKTKYPPNPTPCQ